MELVISKVIRNEKTYVFMLAHILAIETFSQTYSQPNSQSETYSLTKEPSYSGKTSRYTITKESNAYRNPKLYGVDYSVISQQLFGATAPPAAPSSSSSNNAALYNLGYAAAKARKQALAYQEKQRSNIGIKDLGDGHHAAHYVGENYKETPGQVKLKCMEMVRGEALKMGDGGFKIIDEIHVDSRKSSSVLAKTTIFFQIMDKNGRIILSESDKKKLQEEKLAEKSSARQELLELKELLDMGIISQEEFDVKAKTLKIIVLAPSVADEQHTVLSEKNAEGDFISDNGFLKYDGRNFQDNSKGSLRLIIQLGKKYYTASFVGNSPVSAGFVILEDWLEYDEGSKRWTERNDSKTKIPKAAIKGFKYW